MTPLSYAMQVAEETALPLMVHIDEPPPTYVEVVEQLRPGDVLTHCFRPFPNTPLDGDGGVRPEVQAARDRGAFFDIGHGKGSFAFETARKMLAAGFPPDTISSDVHALCAEGPAFDQVTTMSKFLHLGMSMNDVVKGSTETAAKILSRPDLADLSVGSTADISVMSLDDGAFELTDVVGETVTSNQRLTSAGVVRGGKKFSAT
jgi:dihydroorotase